MTDTDRSRQRHFLLVGAAVVILALILRLSVSTQLYNSYPPVRYPPAATDAHTYQQLAGQILDGSYAFDQGFYYQPFYYAAFLPVVYSISGRGPWGVIIVQALLGSAAVWLVILTAAQLFGRRAGLLAGALLALSRFHIFYTPFTLIAALQSFWFALLGFCTVRALRSHKLGWWAATGLFCGLANCTRGNMILLLPILAAGAVYVYRRKWRRLVLALVLLSVFFYLPQLPFAIMNYRAHGHWVGTSSAAGNVLALGNTPEAPPGGLEPGNAGPMAYPETYAYWTQLAERGERSVASSIMQWFLDEPPAFIELKFRMFLLFWNRLEIPNNVSILSAGKPIDSWMLHLPILLDFWLIGSLGLAGLLFSLRHWRARITRTVIAGLVLTYAASIVLFYILARFRLPVLPLLCVFGGYTLCRLWTWLRQIKRPADRRSALWGLAGVGASFLFVTAGYQIYRYGWEAPVMTLARPAGTCLRLEDRTVVFDYGPQRFGGWQTHPIDAAVVVEKDLRLPNPPTAYESVTLRLAVFAPTSGMIELQADREVQAFTIDHPEGSSPIHWISWELPSESYVYTKDGRFSIQLCIRQVAGRDAGLILDGQRAYGRTTVNRQPTGELVLQLVLRP